MAERNEVDACSFHGGLQVTERVCSDAAQMPCGAAEQEWPARA
jgi:hypothetical protein